MIKAVIFDMDGVLVDTERFNRQAFLEIFRKYNIELTQEELKNQGGFTSEEFFRRILKKKQVSNINPKTLSEEKRKLVNKLLEQNDIYIFKGAKELIEKLKEEEIKIAIATSAHKKRAKIIFSKTKLNKRIDVVITADDYKESKPSPELFLLAARRMKVIPKETLVIEDATSGVEAAKRGGMFCIAKDNEIGQDFKKADMVIKGLDEIDIHKIQNRF